MIYNKVYNASEMSNSWNSATWQSTWESWLYWRSKKLMNPSHLCHEWDPASSTFPTNETTWSQRERNLECNSTTFSTTGSPNIDDTEKYWTKSPQCLIINHTVKRMKSRFCQFLRTGWRSTKHPIPSIWYIHRRYTMILSTECAKT